MPLQLLGDVAGGGPRWSEFGALAGAVLVAAVVAAGLTVIASRPRTRPELIRTV